MNALSTSKIVVLDTNVCLDLFVFRDPRWSRLLAALQQGEIEAVTRDDCRAEWLVVLTYPQLKLDQDRQWQSAAEFDKLIACRAKPVTAVSRPLLPLCSDGDDQKFLELAYDERAGVLISKDKAVLKLARKTARLGLFAIMSPETWHQTITPQSDSMVAS
jgi:putative PIN family toxin of toxin-antitoxin system